MSALTMATSSKQVRRFAIVRVDISGSRADSIEDAVALALVTAVMKRSARLAVQVARSNPSLRNYPTDRIRSSSDHFTP